MSLRTVEVYKAQRVRDVEVPSITIEVSVTIPTFADTGKAIEQYEYDAQRIWKALESCLPGGTLSRLRVQAAISAVNNLRVNE